MFIIAGLWHGGTSLVASCVNSHSKLNVFYENQRIFRSFWEKEKEGWKDFVKLEKEATNQGQVLGAKFVENQIFPYKEEWQWRRVEDLQRDYKNVKFIFLYRDARDYAISHTERPSYKTDQLIERWNRFVERSLECRNKNISNSMILKFEDFVENPEIKCKEICQFLGVDYEPSMLNFKMMNQQYAKKYGNKIHKNRKQLWKTFKDQKFIKKVKNGCHKYLFDLGYLI